MSLTLNDLLAHINIRVPMEHLIEIIFGLNFLVFLIILLYSLISLGFIFVMTNNVKFWDRGASKFPFPVTLKFLTNPKRAYWIASNPEHRGWVVLLHFLGGRADSMANRGRFYYDKGYSLLLLMPEVMD